VSRTVTSYGGDEVLVLDDEDLAEMLGVGPEWIGWGLLTSPLRSRTAALGALWYSGPIEDPSGQATARLRELAAALDPGAGPVTRGVLDAPLVRLCWESEVRGRRTFSIRLVGLPERWVEPILAYATTEEKTPAQTPEGGPGVEPVEVPEPCPAPVSAGPAPLPDGLVDEVATALLARVVETLSGAPGSPQAVAELAGLRRELATATEALAASQDRLGEVLEYGRRLKRERDEARDRLGAVTEERDGLRQRLRLAEANLKVAMSQETRSVIDGEVRKEVAKVMRQAPTARSVYDEEEG